MKSEEKLLREMGISSWTLKKNFSFDGTYISKKDVKNISFIPNLLAMDSTFSKSSLPIPCLFILGATEIFSKCPSNKLKLAIKKP